MIKPLMFLNTRSLLLTGLLWSMCFPSPCQVPAEATNVVKGVSPDRIKADMLFLADDALEGRAPGSRGFAIASRYVASRFLALGLQPGVGGSYLQPVPLIKGFADEEKSRITLKKNGQGIDLEPGVDYYVHPNFASTSSSVTGPVVFVGFGIHAPEFGYDDYQNIDVRNKIVVYFNQAPSTFPSNERAYYSSGSVKSEEAMKRGAVGAIAMQLPGDQRSSWTASLRRSRMGTTRWVDRQGVAQPTFEGLKVTATFNPDKAAKLFASSKHDLQEVVESIKNGKAMSFPLNVEAAMSAVTRAESIASSNLVGILPGSDPVLRNEYVVYAAHVDHFGIGVAVAGDSIYNGAHDNASGTSILLEIARTYTELPTRPKRSIVFVVVTGEESGLLGSDYFVHYPTLEGGAMVANLALDMPFFFHPVLDIVPYGAQHSSLSTPLKTAASALGLEIAPDPFPEQVLFIRSDHFSFVRQGIPALFIKSGFKTVPGDTVDRSKSDVAWRTTTYHTPKDDMTQAFDFAGAATHARLNFLVGFLVANDPQKPSWNPNDFFGNKFARQ